MGYSRRHGGKRHSRRHSKQRGGGGAADFVSSVVGGTVDSQMKNVFGSANNTNVIKPLAQSGGGKRHRKQKGGYWEQVINNAIVPLTLFALNKQMHKSRKSNPVYRTYRTLKRKL